MECFIKAICILVEIKNSLTSELQTTKKEGMTISEYLLKMKNNADNLATFDQVISESDITNMI